MKMRQIMQMILSTKELDQIFTSVCVQKTRPTLAPVWELNLMADKELAGGQSSSYFLFSQNYINKGENYPLPPHNDFFWGKRNLMIVLGTNLARIYNFSAGSIIAIAAIVSHFKHSDLTGWKSCPWLITGQAALLWGATNKHSYITGRHFNLCPDNV